MRSDLKRLCETLVVRGGFPALAQVLSRGRRLILAYHNIVPDDAPLEGDHSLHLQRHLFAQQLELLQSGHEVVPLQSLLDCPGSGSSRPRAAITFDDAYRGAVTIGVDELVEHGLPATVFVAPALLGARSFWWDALADPGQGVLPDAVRRRALDELRGEDAAIREWAKRSGHPHQDVPYHARPATLDELRSAVARGGLTLASHTWSHPNLARLTNPELQEELVRPMRWLLKHFDSVIPVLSYPYGISSPEVEKAAAAAGYREAVRIVGRRIPARSMNQYALPRINIPSGLSSHGFILRISGLTVR